MGAEEQNRPLGERIGFMRLRDAIAHSKDNSYPIPYSRTLLSTV